MNPISRRSAILAGTATFAAGQARAAFDLPDPRREAVATIRPGEDFEDPRTTARVAARLADLDRRVGQGPFRADWPSLQEYTVPKWYADAKFGIFIHWGVFSVPAFGSEWYPRNMYQQGSPEFAHHVRNYGPQSKFGYKDFIPYFTGANFDPDAWAALFQQAGARFVVPVAEHHDGFSLYDNGFTEWKATLKGPHRDVIGELSNAIRRHGMVFGCSSHRAEHWWYYDGGTMFDSDVRDPAYRSLYAPAMHPYEFPTDPWMDNWLARTAELVEKYEPQLVWFDWHIGMPSYVGHLQRFAAFYYNHAAARGYGPVINYKFSAFPSNAAVLDIERGQLGGIRSHIWQTDTAVGRISWGYIRDETFKPSSEIIGDLIDIVSKNGILLLNIGPRPDGTIPEQDQAILRDVGAWLATNGEAIYGTTPFKVFGEGPTRIGQGGFNDAERAPYTAQDIRFTTRGDTLYAITLARPEGTLRIGSLGHAAAVTRVSVLGADGDLAFSRSGQALSVTLPAALPGSGAAALRIEGLHDIAWNAV